ncbi:hypothetical protein DB459_02995 [Bradyrhizobium sp. WD16]|nr:hypothetical protein DB459_02995 [Bradyrhizobium sp. WD16]
MAPLGPAPGKSSNDHGLAINSKQSSFQTERNRMSKMTDLVVKVIAKKKQLDEDSISLESIMKESDEEPNLGLDSLDFVEILMELEALLKIEIPLEKVQSARTVGDLISFVSTLAKSREYETGSTE